MIVWQAYDPVGSEALFIADSPEAAMKKLNSESYRWPDEPVRTFVTFVTHDPTNASFISEDGGYLIYPIPVVTMED